MAARDEYMAHAGAAVGAGGGVGRTASPRDVHRYAGSRASAGAADAGAPRRAASARPQKRKSKKQLRQLEELFFGPSREFDPDVRVTSELIDRAMEVTGLAEKQIRQWFQYKRNKARVNTTSHDPLVVAYNVPTTPPGPPMLCSAHKRLMVLYDEPSTRGTRVYVCKGVAKEDGLEACVWSKVQPVAHNKDLLALFRGWTERLDEASPHCSHCNNPLVVCGARQLAKSWEGIDLAALGNAFLVACKAGHVVGSVTMATPELDISMDKGYEPPAFSDL